MSFHFWLSEVAKGASYIDALHHDFIEALVDLSVAQDRDFHPRYDLFITKAESIFRVEEQWMEEINFPELKHHREQHAALLRTLYYGQSQIIRGNTHHGRELVHNLLPEWLMLHTSTMDTALANEIRLTTYAG